MSGKTFARSTGAVAASLLLAACAATRGPPPETAISDAEQEINDAQKAGASQLATFEFTKAQRKLNQSRELARSDSEDERLNAFRLAEQSAVDARLAEAQARLASTRRTYERLESTVESLRQETGLPSGNGEGTQ